jgi:hypothetical protein
MGHLIERVEATGRQMDVLGGKLDRMDEKLEGVAYRRDIEHFVARDEIERRIEGGGRGEGGSRERTGRDERAGADAVPDRLGAGLGGAAGVRGDYLGEGRADGTVNASPI